MISRRALLGSAVAMGAGAGLTALTGCSSASHSADRVTLWGVPAGQAKIQQDIINGFLKGNSGLHVDAKNVPTNGRAGDATSVITAVRGRTAPDLWWMDRFSGAQNAALGLLEPIDDLIAEYESPDFLDAWLPFATNELTYEGKHYGLPTYTDVRGLMYNRTLLKSAGVDPDEFDKATGPLTIQRVMEISDQVNKTDGRGNYTQMGFIPWHGQGFGYTWSVGMRAQYFDNARCEMTMTAEPVQRAFQFLYDYARKYDFQRIDAFVKSYEPLNGPAGQTPFSAGKLAMDLTQSSLGTQFKKYNPKLDWGYTYAPVFNEGDAPWTWAGGFSLVMPKGSSKSRAAWELMKYYAGAAGQTTFCTAAKNLPTRRDVLGAPGIAQNKVAITQLSYATSRPPLPVSALWWDALLDAQNSVTAGSATPQAALRAAQSRVSGQMNVYCPFTLPADYGKTGA